MNDAVGGAINRPRQIRGLLLFLGFIGIVWALTFWIVTGSSQMLVMGGMAIAMAELGCQAFMRAMELFSEERMAQQHFSLYGELLSCDR
jgi:hypothetical protein